MNKKIISDLIDIKHEIINEISQHLPPETGEKIKRLEYELMQSLNEVTQEFLDRTEKPIAPKAAGTVKKVEIE